MSSMPYLGGIAFWTFQLSLTKSVQKRAAHRSYNRSVHARILVSKMPLSRRKPFVDVGTLDRWVWSFGAKVPCFFVHDTAMWMADVKMMFSKCGEKATPCIDETDRTQREHACLNGSQDRSAIQSNGSHPLSVHFASNDNLR